MDARQAFERFEKQGAGLLPVILLTIVAVASTIAILTLKSKIPAGDSEQLIEPTTVSSQEAVDA